MERMYKKGWRTVMLFPQDVNKIVSNASKLGGGEKVRLVIGGTIVANFLIAITVIPFFQSLGVSWIYPLSIQIFLMVFIGIFIFRIFVFKEDEKILEYDQKMKDSFSKYYYLRNLDSLEPLKVRKISVPVFEFDNGSLMTVIRFRFGSNDDKKAKLNRNALTEVYRILGGNGLEFRQIVSKENFSETQEAKRYLEDLSRISDKKLAKTMLDIAQNLYNLSDLYSNVDVIYLEIRTKYSYQRHEFDEVLERVFEALQENSAGFKEVTPLDKKELLNFFRDFYGLEAIDLSLMRVREETSLEDIRTMLVEVYQLVDSEGRVFTNKDSMKSIHLPRRIK
jgi:hypothetical protein